jgi:hypothetical protein
MPQRCAYAVASRAFAASQRAQRPGTKRVREAQKVPNVAFMGWLAYKLQQISRSYVLHNNALQIPALRPTIAELIDALQKNDKTLNLVARQSLPENTPGIPATCTGRASVGTELPPLTLTAPVLCSPSSNSARASCSPCSPRPATAARWRALRNMGTRVMEATAPRLASGLRPPVAGV